MKRVRIIFLFIIIATATNSYSSSGKNEENTGFMPIEYIFDHVSDSHEWHFLTIGSKHISVPLPVILYSKLSGWHFFLSSNFHHPSPDFPFKIVRTPQNELKIAETSREGILTYPLDLSLTKTIMGVLITSIFLIFFLIKATRRLKASPMTTPHGLQNVVEILILFVRDDIAKIYVGKHYARYLPFLLTIFTFVLLANLLGLILPFGLNITGNIAVTFVLAAFTFIITTFSGNRKYWMHIINPDVPMLMKLPIPIIPFIELLGIFIKPIILMIRLFANMFAGHMIVSVLIALIFLMTKVFNPLVGVSTSFISVFFSLFMLIVDLLVSIIQAYIFTLLSAMYFGMAIAEEKH
jgi:F-type H+-transporting ATPase subunit a